MSRIPVLFALLLITNAIAAAEPVTTSVWQEAAVSVTDVDRTAQFFVDIGGYEEKWRGIVEPSEIRSWGLASEASGEALLLGPPGQDTGLVRLIRFDNAGRKEPTRPGARAWDSGCYFSLMVRMKGMQSIYDDAIQLGWWTETPITYLEFGESKLNVMVFRGPDGVQIQGYERLAPPLSDAIPEFDRLTRPFNIMQMVRDRDTAYSFFVDVLGFDTFYKGPPFVSEKPEYMPLGIPKNLTTSVRYRAGIVYPAPGEFGRMEMIEIMDLDGQDYADRCNAPNLGILAVRFPVDNIRHVENRLREKEWPIETGLSSVNVAPYGELQMLNVKTPDGANVQFFERVDLAGQTGPPPVSVPDTMSAVEIVEHAYEYAGGDRWVNPTSLLMKGYGLFWQEGSEEFVRYEPYRMWRVYPEVKDRAHSADGRVRIEAMSDGSVVFQLAFDGTDTYNQDGRLGDQEDAERWASNFGFGVIRHALDDGYSVKRLPDDYVDSAPVYTVQITDATGATTLFNIRRSDFAIVSVGFETPRGWHQRIYSEFFRNENGAWLQPGRVRLFYNGVKANEIYWTEFKTGEIYPIELFQLGD